jgi:peptidoglycan/LPS O-acetylase OafA/YrhL
MSARILGGDAPAATAAPLPASPVAGAGHAATRYVPHIDGLRALAVLAVMAYHLQERWLPGGFAGVDVFFVISGFVVSASVAKWDGGGLGRFLGYFYARRMQRIAPALLACLLLTGFATTLLVPFAWLSHANELTGLHAFFGLSNWYLATHQESYVAPATDFNPYLHTWSLGVEEQFYLLFPLLFFAWTRSRRGRVLATCLFAIALAASLAWAARLGKTDPGAAFYLITTRLWELAAGVLLFALLARWPARKDGRTRQHVLSAGAWCSLALLAFALATAAPSAFPWPGALPAVLGTLGLLGFLGAGTSRGVLHGALGHPAMAAIGRLSYSLYLWHWPVYVLMRWTCGLESAATRGVAVVLTFVLAGLSWRLVEQPLRYSPWLRRLPRTAIVAGGLATIAAAWALAGRGMEARGTVALTTVSRHAADWYPEAPVALADLPGCRVETQVAPAGNTFVAIRSRTGCTPPAAPPPTVFVIGDSHASAYLGLLGEHVLRSGATVVHYPNPGCTLVSLQPERERGNCPAQARDAIADILARARPGDVLFLAALRLPRLSNQYGTVDQARAWQDATGAASLARRRQAEDEALALLAPLAERGLHIVLDAPKPVLPSPPFRCADWFNAGNPICQPGLSIARAEMERYRQPVLDSFARMAARMPALTVWDPFPVLCPGETCQAMRDGRPLFFDGDHISGYANHLLLPSFTRMLESLQR